MATQRGRGKPKRYEGEDSVRLSVLIRPRYREALEIIARDRQSTISEAMELCIASLAMEYTVGEESLFNRIMPEFNFSINFDSYIDKGNLNDALSIMNEIMVYFNTCMDGDFSMLSEKIYPHINNPYLSKNSLVFLHKNIEKFVTSEYFKLCHYEFSLKTPKESFQTNLTDLLMEDIPINQTDFFWYLFGEFYNTGFTEENAIAKVDKHTAIAERKYDHNTLSWNIGNIMKLYTSNEHNASLYQYLEMIDVILDLME